MGNPKHSTSSNIPCVRVSNVEMELVYPITCDICKKSFKSKQTLKVHKVVHNSEKSFRCDECSYSCKRNDQLKSYIKHVHSEEALARKDARQNMKNKKQKVMKLSKRCDICLKMFLTELSLIKHKKSFHSAKENSSVQSVKRRLFRREDHPQYHVFGHTGEKCSVFEPLAAKTTSQSISNFMELKAKLKRIRCVIFGSTKRN